MTTSTCNDPDDREGRRPGSAAIQSKVKTAVRCRLCRESFVLESNFRPTQATCPHCGLEFVFDPQREPLPIRGMRLRYSAVREAQHRPGRSVPGFSHESSTPGSVHHKRHSAHTHRIERYHPPKSYYLTWAVTLVLSLVAAAALYGGWFHRLLSR
jgi:hypothetical protein